jgi:hypothetical protein
MKIAPVRQRFEPDTAAMLAKSIASAENCFCAGEKTDRGSTWGAGEDYPAIQGDWAFF